MAYSILNDEGGLIAVVPEEPRDLPEGWSVVEAEDAPEITVSPPALIAAEERLDEDRLNASLALITQDMLAMRGTLEFFAARGRMPTAQESAAIVQKATERLTELATDEVFREMARPRIEQAKAVRDE